jgi:TolB protein
MHRSAPRTPSPVRSRVRAFVVPALLAACTAQAPDPVATSPSAAPGAAALPGRIVFLADDERGEAHQERLQLIPLRPDGANPPRWTSAPSSQVRNPSWSPDSSFVAFEAAFDDFREIYRLDVATATQRRLTNNPQGNFEPAISPDGKSIAFVSSRDLNAEVYVMTADGDQQTRLTAFHMDDWAPQWTPDSQTIAFLSNRELVDRIFLMRPDGTDQRRLTSDPNPGPDPNGRIGGEPHETDPTFAPDGALAFCVRTGDGASLRVARDGVITTLTDGKFSDRSPSWSPDSQHLVFVSTRDGGDLELYRIARDGKDIARLTDRDGADWLPRWTR